MRRVKEVFLGYLLPIITVLTIDILVMARLASFVPMKYCVLVVLSGTSFGLLTGAFRDVFSDREV